MTSSRVIVAGVADDAYAMPLGVALASAVTNLDPHRTLVCYIVDAGLSDRSRALLSQSLPASRASIVWVSHAGSRLAGLPIWGRMSMHTYNRILAAELLPASVAKLIWLDSDLVVKTDLGKLWDTDLADHALLAAQDMVAPFVSSPLGLSRYRALGFIGREKYFNAGVLLIDLTRWRDEHVADRVIEYLRTHRRHVMLWDQDGLNVVMRDRWGEIDPRWNQNASVCGRPFFRARHLDNQALRQIVDDPWIVHYSGNVKPWIHGMRRHSDALFFEYLDRTAWAGWRPRPNWRASLVGRYAFSGWRSIVYPAELWGFRLWRALTIAPAGESIAPSARRRPS